MGFQLPTSTGEFAGFLNHQQYGAPFLGSAADRYGVPRCSPCDLAAERHGNVESLWGSVAARGAGVMGVCGNCQCSFCFFGWKMSCNLIHVCIYIYVKSTEIIYIYIYIHITCTVTG